MESHTDEIKKIHYMILGLNSYNKYLRRNLSLQFSGTKVYGDILGTNYRKITKDLREAFDEARLKPIEILYESVVDKHDLFVRQRIGQNVKDGIAFLAGLVPVVILLLHLLLPQYFPDSGD